MASTHTPRRQRRIQEQVARAEKARPKQEPKRAMQAGARKYPAPPFPEQQSKPGSESHLDPAPLYNAPFYLGSRKLDKKVALITGGDSGVGRSVAIPFAREAVAPGPVWTPLNTSDKEAKAVSKFGADTPMKRPAQPEEIAPPYVFLASPQCSSYITDEVLPIMGGYSGG
jgi:hypothetical protein